MVTILMDGNIKSALAGIPPLDLMNGLINLVF
jgi:hypothetical protein